MIYFLVVGAFGKCLDEANLQIRCLSSRHVRRARGLGAALPPTRSHGQSTHRNMILCNYLNLLSQIKLTMDCLSPCVGRYFRSSFCVRSFPTVVAHSRPGRLFILATKEVRALVFSYHLRGVAEGGGDAAFAHCGARLQVDSAAFPHDARSANSVH